jgi:uncharacterized protein (DUF1800 family)
VPDRRTHAWIAAHRFGLGPRPGDLDAIAGDPRGWLLSQLEGPPPASPERAALPDHMAVQRELATKRAADQATKGGGAGKSKAARRYQRATLGAESRARLLDAATTDAPFHERLTRFWSDHFTTSATQRRARHLVGAHEREAVRPHVAGRFADMLLASTRHPAMLLYLDNAGSIGPDTTRAQRRDKGLNENLAREILELHTLGVGGGYRQADVIALAELITGWTVFGGPPRGRMDLERPHGFSFREDLHQPGRKTLLGRRYGGGGGGVGEGEAALRDLAAHPSTPRFLATKLCRHFLGPQAPPAAVNAIAESLRTSGGDLKVASRVLVEHPASWVSPAPGQGALRDPSRLLVAMARAVDLGGWSGRRKDWADKVLDAQAWLGQPAFSAPSPAGWSDDPADWTGPEQVLRRVELAFQVGTKAGGLVPDPGAWADDLLAPVLDDDTRQAVRRAGSRAEAVAFALASPAFQWT